MITVQTSNLSIMYINITDHKLANIFLNSLIVCALIMSVGNELHSSILLYGKSLEAICIKPQCM